MFSHASLSFNDSIYKEQVELSQWYMLSINIFCVFLPANHQVEKNELDLTFNRNLGHSDPFHSLPSPSLPKYPTLPKANMLEIFLIYFFFFPQGLLLSQRFRRDGNNNQHLAFMNPQRAISVTHEMYNSLWAGLRVVFVEVTSLLHQCRATSISILPGSAILILKISIVFLTSVELFLLTAAELLASSF